MALRETMQADLTAAMRARDRARASLLRTTLAAIANAEAVDHHDPSLPADATEVARRHLTEADVAAVVRAEVAELDASAAVLRGAGRADAAADLEDHAAVLSGYLGGAGQEALSPSSPPPPS